MKKALSLLLICCLSLFISCKKEQTPTPELGYDYFPLTEGTYIIYDVDSTYYDDFFVPRKELVKKYQLKEYISELFLDNSSQVTAKIERSIRNYDSLTPYENIPWELKNVYTSTKTNTTAERVEDNQRYVRLSFPLQKNTPWDSNIKNVLPPENISYLNYNKAENIGGIAFENVLQTALSNNAENLIEKKYSTEKYIKNIGLAYKERLNLFSQADQSLSAQELETFYNLPFEERITSGYKFTWVINTYGKE